MWKTEATRALPGLDLTRDSRRGDSGAEYGKHARCIRLVNVRGRIIQNGKAGRSHFTFKGKIGGRSVGPGTYQLIATPAGGRPSDVTFKIVR